MMTTTEKQERIKERAEALARQRYRIDKGGDPGHYVVRSPRGVTYTVRLYQNGSTECDCPGSRHHPELVCKHAAGVTLLVQAIPCLDNGYARRGVATRADYLRVRALDFD